MSSVVAAQSAADLMGGLDTVKKGASEAGTRDCEKADAEQKKFFDEHMDDPQAAVFGGAKLGCTYLERIAWKAPTTKSVPKPKASKGTPSATEVTRRAADWWAGSDDMNYVKVLSGGVLGTWQRQEMSDTPGVASSRTIGVYHVIVAALGGETSGCFVVYGQLAESNVNHPDANKPPAWSAAEYKASDWQRAQKVTCPKGAKPPKPS